MQLTKVVFDLDRWIHKTPRLVQKKKEETTPGDFIMSTEVQSHPVNIVFVPSLKVS